MRQYKTCPDCDYNFPDHGKSKYPLYYSYCPMCCYQLNTYSVETKDCAKPRKYYRVPADAITEHNVSIENNIDNLLCIGSNDPIPVVGPRRIIHTITFEGKKPLKVELDVNGVVNRDWGL